MDLWSKAVNWWYSRWYYRAFDWWYRIKTPAVRYAVIVDVPGTAHPEGNLYDELLVKKDFVTGYGHNCPDEHESLYTDVYDPSTPIEEMLRVKLSVFRLGEILLVNPIGREIVGAGRKPSKWAVGCEYYFSRRTALKRAMEVIAKENERWRDEQKKKHEETKKESQATA